MIIELLLNLLLGFLRLLFSGISFPVASSDMITNFNTFLSLLDYADTFLPLFVPVDVTAYLIIVVGLFTVDHLYRPIKWIINAILEVIP